MSDQDFFTKITPFINGKMYGLPQPSLTPEQRSQLRTSFTNHMNLYKRKCDATGKSIITAYHPDINLKVYDLAVWHDVDQHESLNYGREYDFSRTFFEQYAELAQVVPRPSLIRGHQYDENSEYTNYAGKNKNCYMIFDSDGNHDCYYSYGIANSKSCVDCYRVNDSELCYECVDCNKSYALYYSQDSENCSNSAFLKNCIGCKNCFMCSNLKNKEYYIYNKKSTKEEFDRVMAFMKRRSEVERLLPHWDEFRRQFPQKYVHGFQNEDIVGDYLVNCKNAVHCYDSVKLWDCAYVTRSVDTKDAMHSDEVVDGCELVYESAVVVYNCQNILFSYLILTDCSNIMYSGYMNYSSNCFGCIGLQRKKYCILNKQYTKEEYEELLPRIIDHMKSTGEWGGFFPAYVSDFGYNDTVAEDFFPLNKEQAAAQGFKWVDKIEAEYGRGTKEIPDDIFETTVDTSSTIYTCKISNKDYKITDQELKFYQQNGIALPDKCFQQRHKSRFNQRNKRVLYDRNCAKTNEPIKTTYPPDSNWIVYSGQAYLDSFE
jgi:hypothetical protein